MVFTYYFLLIHHLVPQIYCAYADYSKIKLKAVDGSEKISNGQSANRR